MTNQVSLTKQGSTQSLTRVHELLGQLENGDIYEQDVLTEGAKNAAKALQPYWSELPLRNMICHIKTKRTFKNGFRKQYIEKVKLIVLDAGKGVDYDLTWHLSNRDGFLCKGTGLMALVMRRNGELMTIPRTSFRAFNQDQADKPTIQMPSDVTQISLDKLADGKIMAGRVEVLAGTQDEPVEEELFQSYKPASIGLSDRLKPEPVLRKIESILEELVGRRVGVKI